MNPTTPTTPHPALLPYPSPLPKPGKRNFPWIYRIDEDFVYAHTGWKLQKRFVSTWLDISRDGVIAVKANKTGYAWDGCTPKVSIFNIWIWGVPDGHVDYRTMRPYTYYASMVHDAMC